MNVSLAALCFRWQRVAVVVALLNSLIYVLTLAWAWFGSFGIAWTHLLNRTVLGDILLAWFCISAILLLAYALIVQFSTRAVTLAGIAGMSWCFLWVAELLWLHQFLVFD